MTHDREPGRAGHLFLFPALDIAKACRAEAEYHRKRLKHWEAVRDKAKVAVEKSVSAKLVEQDVTGGKQFAVVAEYGDRAAWNRLTLAQQKIPTHRALAEQFEREATVYGTQRDRSYELVTADVHYFRLGGANRED